jgi:hypothetical protein
MKNLKNFILFITFASSSILISAQSESSYGIKGGLNYNANGDYFESISSTVEHPKKI